VDVWGRASGGPVFSALPEKTGEKRGAGLRFGACCGYNSSKSRFFSRFEHTYAPCGRYGARRLLWYNQIREQLRLNSCGKNALRSKPVWQYEFAEALVGAGLCSARQKAAVLRNSLANSIAPAHLVVGADAHIGPVGSCEFAEDSRKTGISCGRTESCAPTGESEGRCRGRRLCRPIERLRIRQRFPYKRCILPGRCVPASGRPTSVTLLRRERL